MSWLITAILVMTFSIAQAPEQPATAPIDPYSEYAIAALRVFHTQAMMHASLVRIYATEAQGIGEKDRAELLKLLDDFKHSVNEEVKKLRADLPRPNEIYNRAEHFGQEFDESLEAWLEAHPDAKAAVDRQELIFQLMIDDLLQGGKEVIAAAQRAGLDKGAQNLAKNIVQDAFDGFQQYARGITTWQEVAARAPKDSAQYLESTLIMTNTEMFKLETAQTVRRKLRELIPAQRHAHLDEELVKLAEGR